MGLEHRILSVGRQVAVELKEREVARRREWGEAFFALTDFADAGKKNEAVARGMVERGGHTFLNKIHEWATIEVRQILHVHRKCTTAAFDRGAISQVVSNGLGLEGGGHDHDFQVGPHGLLDLADHGQGQIAGLRALVELIEYDGSYIGKE